MKRFAVDLQGKNFENLLSASFDADRKNFENMVSFREMLTYEREFVSETRFQGKRAQLYKINCEVFLTIYEDPDEG